VEKAGFKLKTLGTKAERYDHCATRQVERLEELNHAAIKKEESFSERQELAK
jgi:hypothetical protein